MWDRRQDQRVGGFCLFFHRGRRVEKEGSPVSFLLLLTYFLRYNHFILSLLPCLSGFVTLQHGMSNVRVRADVGAVKVSVPAFLPKRKISKLASSNSNIRKSYLHNLGIDGGCVCACMCRNLLRILGSLRVTNLALSMFFLVNYVLSLVTCS